MCITFARNWNWMRSPAFAMTLLGEKMSEPLGPPTWTMCVLTIPAGVVDPDSDEPPVDKLPRADAVAEARRDSDAATEDCAAAKPMRAETMTDLEKYILFVVLLFFTNWTE
jgi:hypothetical protein